MSRAGCDGAVAACRRTFRPLATWPTALIVLSGILRCLTDPSAARAQSAGTVPVLDPAYDDLARLEAFGLVGDGLSAQRPISAVRLVRLIERARVQLSETSARGERPGDSPSDRGGGYRPTGRDLPPEARADVAAILDRLERRFGVQTALSHGLAEVEAAAGRADVHGIPDNGTDIGSLDAVVDPLHAYRGGRSYGRHATGAVAAGLILPLGTRVALGGQARVGDVTSAVEQAYVRVVSGAFALQVGRDWVSTGRADRPALLLSDNGPPLDLVRIATDRPLRVPGLGVVDLTLLGADLGPDQNFPHAKLFVAKVSAHPTPALEVGVTALDKQGGDGAPKASLGDRLKDLSFVWDLFRPGRDYLFSEKLVSVDFRAAFPDARGLAVYGEVALNDLDPDRLGDVFSADAAYLLGVSVPRLGVSRRHGLLLEAQSLGPTLYRHHQFRTGLAVDGKLQGSSLGPSGAGVRAQYSYDAPSAGWRASAGVALERRSVDPYAFTYHPVKDIVRVGDAPDEIRRRVRLRVRRWLWDGAGGVEVEGALESVRAFAYTAGDDRTQGLALVRIWHAF